MNDNQDMEDDDLLEDAEKKYGPKTKLSREIYRAMYFDKHGEDPYDNSGVGLLFLIFTAIFLLCCFKNRILPLFF